MAARNAGGADALRRGAADLGTAAGPADLHLYEAAGHLFLDPALPDHDPDAAAACLSRADRFLDRF